MSVKIVSGELLFPSMGNGHEVMYFIQYYITILLVIFVSEEYSKLHKRDK